MIRPIDGVAGDLGLSPSEILLWGEGVAKLRPEAAFRDQPPQGRLVLVSAMSPTPAGEGKTTCAIGLTQAVRMRNVRAVCALRQPSLGPVFGKKGGGTGGGRAELAPRERINLHFTGDLHAVTAAHDLLAALVDNALHFGEAAGLDGRRVIFRRVLDVDDRALRHVIVGLGGHAAGIPRETGFDVSAASEVMAILCLARDWADLRERLGGIIVGWRGDGTPVHARDLAAHGAMAALLRDALLPNLVQTAEGAPALVHGGPFANLAHGCSSLIATRFALGRAELVLTEAGFGFDLGGEKFLDITCRSGGIWPDAIVLVATTQALERHGMDNLAHHVERVRRFGFEPIVALNTHAGDSQERLAETIAELRQHGIEAHRCDVFARGGEGALELADRILESAQKGKREPRFLYAAEAPPVEKMRRIACEIYGAKDVVLTGAARKQLEEAEAHGFAQLPVCMAKTHLSLSDDPTRFGRPRDFTLTVNEVRIAAGAGLLVALAGDILTMPGLPERPHAAEIDLLADGTIVGVH